MARQLDPARPEPDPADLSLSAGEASAARVVGPSGSMSFGYPAFTPAESVEFSAQIWGVGETGFEQIGNAEVIRAGLGARDAGWDPLTDPWPAVERSVATIAQETEPWPDTFDRPTPTDLMTQPVDLEALFAAEPPINADHPSGPLPQAGSWPPPAAVPDSLGPWLDTTETVRYDATLSGALGSPERGFRDGCWYSVLTTAERPISVGAALRSHPQLAGQITQLACWWIRRNPMSERALDLASELANAVADLARR
jgi:hypothetical protein